MRNDTGSPPGRRVVSACFDIYPLARRHNSCTGALREFVTRLMRLLLLYRYALAQLLLWRRGKYVLRCTTLYCDNLFIYLFIFHI